MPRERDTFCSRPRQRPREERGPPGPAAARARRRPARPGHVLCPSVCLSGGCSQIPMGLPKRDSPGSYAQVLHKRNTLRLSLDKGRNFYVMFCTLAFLLRFGSTKIGVASVAFSLLQKLSVAPGRNTFREHIFVKIM